MQPCLSAAVSPSSKPPSPELEWAKVSQSQVRTGVFRILILLAALSPSCEKEPANPGIKQTGSGAAEVRPHPKNTTLPPKEEFVVDPEKPGVSPGIQRILQAKDLPKEKAALVEHACRRLIDLNRWRRRHLGGGEPSAVVDYFKKANETGDTAALRAYEAFTPLIISVAITEMTQDPSYAEFLRASFEEGSLKRDLSEPLGRAAAALKDPSVPNIYDMSYDQFVASMRTLSSRIESEHDKIGIPELFLSDDFLTASAAEFMDNILTDIISMNDCHEVFPYIRSAITSSSN